jgi:threonine/homoserine/homoserine lactone efflux protein
MIAISLADHAQDARMSYPAPAPQPGWYPDPSGGPGQRYFDGHQWTISAPPPIIINNFVAPASRPNTALHLALTVFTCGMWLPVWLVIALVDNQQARAVGQPSRTSPVLIALLAAVGGLYLIGLATASFQVFLSLLAVATLGFLGYLAYQRAADRRAEDARIAGRAEAQHRAYISGDSSGLYGQYPPVQPPDLPQ